MAILELLSGYKTYLAAAGLLALGIYQASFGDVLGAAQCILAALTAAGLRHAVAKVTPP